MRDYIKIWLTVLVKNGFLGSKSYFYSFIVPGAQYLQFFIFLLSYYYYFTRYCLYKTIYSWQILYNLYLRITVSEPFFLHSMWNRPCLTPLLKNGMSNFLLFLFLAFKKANYARICKNGALLLFFLKNRKREKFFKILH